MPAILQSIALGASLALLLISLWAFNRRSALGAPVLIVAALVWGAFETKLFSEGATSPVGELFRGLKIGLVIVGFAAIALVLGRTRSNAPLFILFAVWGWLGFRALLEGFLPQGALLALASLTLMQWAVLKNGTKALRLGIVAPSIFVVASGLYTWFSFERAFSAPAYSEFVGWMPIGQFMGLATHPNHFGIAMGIGIISFLSLGSRGVLKKLALVGLVAGLVSSGSDAAIGATALGATAVLSLGHPERRASAGAIFLGISLSLGIVLLSVSAVLSRGFTSFTTGRTNIWASFLSPVADAGLLGYGRPDYEGSTAFDPTAASFRNPHNALMDVALSGGVVGALLLVIFWAAILNAVRRMNPGENKNLALGLSVILLLTGVVESNAQPDISFAAFGYILLVASITADRSSKESKRPIPGISVPNSKTVKRQRLTVRSV